MGSQCREKKQYVHSSLAHIVYLSNILLCQLTCDCCEDRELPCSGVWGFSYQRNKDDKYLFQCRRCRKNGWGCSFRELEGNGGLQKSAKQLGRVGKEGSYQQVILISDSESDKSCEETQVAGPSSRPQKKARVKNADRYERLKDTLLEARKRRVEIETEAEVELAKIDSVIKEAERDLKTVK